MKLLNVMAMVVSGVAAASTTEGTVEVKSQDVEFLTKLVSDVSNHAVAYFFYLRTADVKIPKYVGSLVDLIESYSDDSYTTLLEDPNFPITSIENFVTHLDWYSSRLSVDGINQKSSTAGSSHLYVPVGVGIALGIVGLL